MFFAMIFRSKTDFFDVGMIVKKENKDRIGLNI
jgi:hypothetical protein